jgi:hypothetical protein
MTSPDSSPAGPEPVAEGRFYELQQELGPRRRVAYKLTADIEIPPITRGQLRSLRRAVDDDEQMAIILGVHYDAVEALFADRPAEEWFAFQRDVYGHFFGQGSADLPGGSQGS